MIATVLGTIVLLALLVVPVVAVRVREIRNPSQLKENFVAAGPGSAV